MKPYSSEPLTPRMLIGLQELQSGGDLDFKHTSVGLPTKQRLAKHGLAAFMKAKDWDGPMCMTMKGIRVLRDARQSRYLFESCTDGAELPRRWLSISQSRFAKIR
jgi:hypothetical protein